MVISSSSFLFAQETHFENYDLEPVQVNMSITKIDGKEAVRVTRDTPSRSRYTHFVRLKNTDGFGNGTIEVMLLSRLLPTADANARVYRFGIQDQ
jgi:hypothetical protein